MRQARQYLQGIEYGCCSASRELEVEITILVRDDVLEDFLVRDVRPKSVGADIERGQERLAVGDYIEKLCFIIRGRRDEEQVQFIGAGSKGYVVRKLSSGSPVIESEPAKASTVKFTPARRR